MSRSRRTSHWSFVSVGAALWLVGGCSEQEILLARFSEQGGSSALGGNPSRGGDNGRGGASSGGLSNEGGEEPSSGTSALGGTSATGGTTNGGTTPNGGSTGLGGTPSIGEGGGMDGSGGADGIGGSGASGGSGTSGGNGGSGGTEPLGSCFQNSDCPDSTICDKRRCEDERGICRVRPLLCDSSPDPVCGCDGVTYWNTCMRLSAGIVSQTYGQCTFNAVPCRGDKSCSEVNGYCGRLRFPGEPCNPDAPGVCWVVPDSCDPTNDPVRWEECGSGQNPPGRCIDSCNAIKSGRQHTRPRPDTCLPDDQF